jgi:MFS family permease
MKTAKNGLYYGWIVVAITAITMIISAGLRSAPGVMLQAIEADTGWTRNLISFAVSLGLLLYGLAGPFAGKLMDTYGPRAVMLAGLLIMGLSSAISGAMTQQWQLHLFWGVLGGLGTGLAASVLGSTVANRWFVARRGLVMGIFGASTSAGQLIFVPMLMSMVTLIGWRTSNYILGGIALLLLIPVFIWMRNSPSEINALPYGASEPLPSGPSQQQGGVMQRAIRSPEFWLLSSTFFICGATSNGLIGTHFIAHTTEHGIAHQAAAANTLALMGAMNFVGTLVSGWLTDRYNPRILLAIYYGFRGLSLLFLPFVNTMWGLTIFAIMFGLDYIATVPPTSTLVADIFGRKHVGTVFGWVFCAHQIGAALAAWLGGQVRTVTGDYGMAFLAAGILSATAAVLSLRIRKIQVQLAVNPS